MSLFGSLFSGVSGLSAQSRAMSMISDNIANVSTTGYKGTNAQFADLVTGGGGAQNYSAGGVRAQGFRTVGSQGLIQSSGSALDAAISGAGFFVVNSQATGTGEQVYTRDGAFAQDALGNLTTPAGYYLQGWALDDKEQIANINQLQTINIADVKVLAAATTKVEVDGNLDADQAVFAGPYAAGDLANWVATDGAGGVEPDLSHEMQIYDSLGRAHQVTVAFLRTGAANTWSVEVMADPADVDVAQHPNGLLASGTITFGGDGSLAATNITPVISGVAGTPVEIAWNAAQGADPSSITLDLGTIGTANGLSQYSDPTKISAVHQDGSAVGDLVGVAIDQQGYVTASFDNGETRKLYQLALATFASPSQLQARSGNLFAATDAAGSVALSTAGSGGAGSLTPYSLEAADVDLADEFTKMIVTQRAYSANAKVVNTADQMLDELIRLGR